VTPRNPANNQIEVTVAGGWYSGAFGHQLAVNNYGEGVALLYALVIAYTDGRMDTVVSDSSWTWRTGPLLYSNIYHGEVYDARVARNESKAVMVKDFRKDHIVPSTITGFKDLQLRCLP
jgi:alpha-L-rhamnosidase